MAKFKKEIDPVRREQFLRASESRRQANLSIGDDPVLVCAQCGWKIYQSAAQARGISACQQCGSRHCKVHNMDYNLELQTPARPDVNTIMAQEQAMQARMRRK